MKMNKELKDIVRCSTIEIKLTRKDVDEIPSYLNLNLNPKFATELQIGDLIIIDRKELENDSIQIHNNWQNNPWRHLLTNPIEMCLLTRLLPFMDNNKLICKIEERSFHYGGEVVWFKGTITLKNNS